MIVGRGSSKDAENLPSLCLASCYIPFLHYYVNGVVMAVCMLKNFYIKILCLKIKHILGKEKKSWKLKSRIADIENTRISLEYKVEQNKKGGKSELKHKKSTVTDEEVHYQEKKK